MNVLSYFQLLLSTYIFTSEAIASPETTISPARTIMQVTANVIEACSITAAPNPAFVHYPDAQKSEIIIMVKCTNGKTYQLNPGENMNVVPTQSSQIKGINSSNLPAGNLQQSLLQDNLTK